MRRTLPKLLCFIYLLNVAFVINLVLVTEVFTQPRQVETTGSIDDEGAMTIADVGISAADISEPFDIVGNSHSGWCIAQGVLSDLAVDLDSDGQVERLVVHFAPAESYMESVDDSEPDNEDDWQPSQIEHPLGRKDLCLAIFKEKDGVLTNIADIIIEPSLVMYYANIRVSVWGNVQKHIYIRSATARYDAIRATYCVFTFHEDKLHCELALADPGFTDAWGLYKVDIGDVSNPYEVDYTRGLPIDVDFHYEGTGPEMVGIAEDNFSNQSDGNANDSEHYDCNTYADFEPANRNPNYSAALQEQLSTFSIDDTKDTNISYCTPVCEIRYYFDSDCDSFRITDYTGVVR